VPADGEALRMCAHDRGRGGVGIRRFVHEPPLQSHQRIERKVAEEVRLEGR